jgi:2'-5' RNA ligase
VRCFVALGLDDGPGQALAPWLESTRARFPELAVSPAVNLHLTLAFLPEVGDEQVELAAAAVRTAAKERRAWWLQWTSPGVFPSAARPRVLWLGVDGGEMLVAAHGAVNLALTTAGMVSEERVFRPHLTLARVRRRDLPRQRYKDIVAHLGTLPTPGSSRVVALVLYESRLGRGSAVHTPLVTAPLGDCRLF